MTVLIVSESLGIFLGSCLGFGFWSKVDPVGQMSAPVFANHNAALGFVATWADKPSDLSYVPITPDFETYASMECCVAAGLEPWAFMKRHPKESTIDYDTRLHVS